LRNLGKLKEAEKSTLKAIELNPHLASAYFSLSTLKYCKEMQLWKNYKDMLNPSIEILKETNKYGDLLS